MLIKLSTLAENTAVSVHCIRTYVDQGLVEVKNSSRCEGSLSENCLFIDSQ